ncbi:MAG: hypothetical protein ACKVHA_00270 [Fidelibacterota bacterium]
MKKVLLIFVLPLFFFVGCEDEQLTNENEVANTIEIVTNDIMDSNFYYNFVTQSIVDSTSIWHFSAKSKQVEFAGQLFGMPSIFFGDVYAQLSDSTYSEVTIPPGQTSPWYQDNSVVEYGGEDEIISYNMTTHVASIEKPTDVFIIYEYIGHTTYKVQFLDYTAGILSFQFFQL